MNKLWIRYLILWAVNSLIIYLAAAFYPFYFVLGSAKVSMFWGAVISGFALTLLCKIAKILISKTGFKPKGRTMMMAFYWLVNSIAIWLIAKVPMFTGFGISKFYWAVVLGFVTNLGQWIVRQFFKKSSLL